MIRLIAIYGAVLAALAFMLEWLGFKHAMRMHSTAFYVVVVAVVFAVLGIWIGHRLTPASRSGAFVPNVLAMSSLGISTREREILELVAAGHSNKVIARQLSISPNTVKTHVAHLFERLEVTSRTQAISKARSLDILP